MNPFEVIHELKKNLELIKQDFENLKVFIEYEIKNDIDWIKNKIFEIEGKLNGRS